jgi:hypothetical protein
MTVVEPRRPSPFEQVTFDLYRDIHKGIRTELFAVTSEAGALDPADRLGRAALADQWRSVSETLIAHAEHEDGAIQPVIETHLPALAERITDEHEVLEGRIGELVDLVDSAVEVAEGDQRARLHRVYVELASFTASYLEHQDLEERLVMPELELAIGLEAVLAIHGEIISNIPPDEMAASLAIMIPAMNVDDRAELLAGMRAGAPPEAFDAVWGLVGSVLEPADHAVLGRRLDLT